MDNVPAVRSLRTRIISAIGVLAVLTPLARADDLRDFPARLGRLFRLEPRSKPSPKPKAGNDGEALPLSDRLNRKPTGEPIPTRAELPGGMRGPAVESPSSSDGGASPRILAQPRVSRPITHTDPIVTRIAIGRSDNGQRFGMFLQIYADGTVLDSEGVHRIGPDLLGPIQKAIAEGDLTQRQGHCGGPSTDFVEMYQLVVYDRAFRGIRASSLSYTSNMEAGCDASIRKLHQAIENVILKVAGQSAGAMASPNQAAHTPAPLIAPVPATTASPLVQPSSAVLPTIPDSLPPSANPFEGASPPPLQPLGGGGTSIPLTPLPD